MLKNIGLLVLAFLLLASIFVGAMGVLLAGVAHTTPGRLAGLGSLALASVPWMLLFERSRGWLAVPLVGGGLAWGAASWHAPDGRTPTASCIEHHLPEGRRFRRHAMSNIVPEVDQFELGSWLIPFLDLHMGLQQGAEVRELFRAVYEDTREQDCMVQAGSAMPWAYAELVPFAQWNVGHRYLVVPEAEEPLPVVLFLHGSLGNFKGYQQVLGELARERGFAVVSPSFGLGNWWRPEGVEVVGETLRAIEEDPRLDGERVVLVGLSNGGLGVTRALEAYPQHFEGVLYVTGVVEPQRMAELELAPELPVLLLAGVEDRRLPIQLERQAVQALPQAELMEAPGQDHFLMFRDPALVGQALARLGR